MSIDIPVALLVGGKGTRLRSVVSQVPKALAPIGGGAFLELLIRQLQDQGLRRVVMCTGFLADHIEDRFGGGGNWGLEIEYSRETVPLGTAGALKLAEKLLSRTDDFVAMNGDSFSDVDLNALIRFHRVHPGIAAMAVHEVADTGRYGTVQVGAEDRVVGFQEKSAANCAGAINAGVYVFSRAILDHIPAGESSLERDILPRLLEEGVYASPQNGIFIDIGVPEDYARAQALYDRLRAATVRR